MSKPDLPEAKEPTAEDVEVLRKRVTQLETKVKRNLRNTAQAMWWLAKALYEFDQERGWGVLGYRNIGEWLADPEVGLTKSRYYALVKCYRVLVIERNVEVPALGKLDPTKVEIVVPAIQAGEKTVESALSDVEALGWRDLRETYVTGPQTEQESAPEPDPVSEPEVRYEPDGSAPVDGDDVIEGTAVDDRERVEEPPIDDVGALDEALPYWQALYGELTEAAASGTAQPRVDSEVISRGLNAYDHIVRSRAVERSKILEILDVGSAAR